MQRCLQTRHTRLGRSDAVLNPGGVRIGTAEIYRQVAKVEEVADCVCIGQDWQNDTRVVLFVVLREGLQLDDGPQAKIRDTIRRETTSRHVRSKILRVTDIPRTISGKVVELAVRKIVHDRPVRNRDPLANPAALEQYRDRPELQAEPRTLREKSGLALRASDESARGPMFQ